MFGCKMKEKLFIGLGTRVQEYLVVFKQEE